MLKIINEGKTLRLKFYDNKRTLKDFMGNVKDLELE